MKRNSLPRPEKAGWLAVIIAISAVLVALWGNIVMPPKEDLPSNLSVFLLYFIPTILFISVMLNRTAILKLVLKLLDAFFDPIRKFSVRSDRNIKELLHKINKQEFVFFTKGDNIATLNKVMLYIERNEHTKKIKIVTVIDEGKTIPPNLEQEISFLDREYPEIDIELVIMKGKFSPELIQELSEKWNIPVNFMFIGSPGDKFPYKIEELGGVRLII